MDTTTLPPPPSQLAAPHACPRCDYDLSGETSRWEASCPTLGMCPECGLTFAWRDVLNPARRRLPGFVEHEIGVPLILSAIPRTAIWALRPGEFWRRVTLFMPIRLSRAIFMMVVITTPTIVGVAIATHRATAALPVPYLEVFLVAMLAESVIIPITLLLLPDTRKIAKVRTMHVYRAATYGLMWIVMCGMPLFTALLVCVLAPTMLGPPGWGILPPGPTTPVDWAIAACLALACLCTMIWFVFWWRHAIRSWRLPSPKPVGISLALIGLLTMLIFVGPVVAKLMVLM